MSFFFGFLEVLLTTTVIAILVLSTVGLAYKIRKGEKYEKFDCINLALSWILFLTIYKLFTCSGKIYFYLLIRLIFSIILFLINSYNREFNLDEYVNTLTLNDNIGAIYCLKILDDGRLAAGDDDSNLIIYDKETFKPDIIINNNLSSLLNFTQLKNKNIICSFRADSTLKIIKIKNKKEYENIQIINNAHNNAISKIIELKNENIITFSYDYSFKIWKLNNNNRYEKMKEFIESNFLSDGLETKDNEEILYSLNTYPQSLVFFNINKNVIITELNNLYLSISYVGERITKLNDNEIAIAGGKSVYLIDINSYCILNEINTVFLNLSILKLTNNIFLIGDANTGITQYRTYNNIIIRESFKNNIHENESWIYSLAFINGMIITGGFNSNQIKIWKKSN